MSKQSPSDPLPAFTPAAPRRRHDGWTPARQRAFVEALAASACVDEACRSVGLSPSSAYRLRARPDAQPFRLAWDAALDFAIRRLSDAVLSRALNGEPIPHYYKGEQVGEHRRYDNRLAQFLLRYRDPLRYAATMDQMVFTGDPEVASFRLAARLARLATAPDGLDPAERGSLPWSAAPVLTPAQEAIIRKAGPRNDYEEEGNAAEKLIAMLDAMTIRTLDPLPEEVTPPDVA